MAVPAKNIVNQAVAVYETSSGKVTLTPEIIRKYLVNGNGNVTDQEVMMFLNLCRYQRLNPFLREAYLIKYGTQPATMVVGKETFTKRAEAHPQFDGMEAGVIVQKADKSIEYRSGALVLPNEQLVGGWAKVYRKDWQHSIEITVSLAEYQQMKDGKPAANWAKMPATMIRKVALMQALREAFPNELGGMYGAEEMQIDASTLPNEPVTIDVRGEVVEEVKANGVKLATEAQRKRLFALAKEAGLENEQLKQIIKDETGKETSKDLTQEEIQKLFAMCFNPS